MAPCLRKVGLEPFVQMLRCYRLSALLEDSRIWLCVSATSGKARIQSRTVSRFDSDDARTSATRSKLPLRVWMSKIAEIRRKDWMVAFPSSAFNLISVKALTCVSVLPADSSTVNRLITF